MSEPQSPDPQLSGPQSPDPESSDPESSDPESSGSQSPGSFGPGFEKTAATTAAGAASRRRYLRLPGRRRSRWALGVAAVVVLGVAAVGSGVALERHHDRSRAVGFFGPDRPDRPERPGVPFGPDAPGVAGPKQRDGRAGTREHDGRSRAVPGGRTAPGAPGAPGVPGVPGAGSVAGGAVVAPAPLPGVTADQAVAKAAGAVSGGKVAGLAVVGREGGGSSWAVTVLGPDGVRHLVTVDGTDGSVTGNSVVDGR
ncbi:hypothetical protein ACIQBJ_11045 [Kitasatospora sp. NPDC088391]|uniref:PepSY domain-containing protein n=1 Tax=Kitasatospora sp. NPDC088391 TaxID=3364074 RepID=UPI0038260000